MTVSGWAQILIVLALVVAIIYPMGRYMADLFEGRRTFPWPWRRVRSWNVS